MASLWLTKTGLSCPVKKTSNLWLTKTEVVLTDGEDLELLAGLVHALLQAGGQGPGQGQQGRPMVAMFIELLNITKVFIIKSCICWWLSHKTYAKKILRSLVVAVEAIYPMIHVRASISMYYMTQLPNVGDL